MTEKIRKKLTPDELIIKRKKALNLALRKKTAYLNRKALKVWNETKTIYFENIDQILITENLEYLKKELKLLLNNLPIKEDKNG